MWTGYRAMRQTQVMTAQLSFRPTTLRQCARRTKALPGMKNTSTRIDTTLRLRRLPWMALYTWLGKYSRDTGGADIQGIGVMGYYDDTDLPYYYFMASQFATSD